VDAPEAKAQRTVARPAVLFLLASLANIPVVYLIVRERPPMMEMLFPLIGLLAAGEAWAAGRLLEGRKSFIPALCLLGGVVELLLVGGLWRWGPADDGVFYPAATALAAPIAVVSLLAWKDSTKAFTWWP
jgi:hypothetical protein